MLFKDRLLISGGGGGFGTGMNGSPMGPRSLESSGVAYSGAGQGGRMSATDVPQGGTGGSRMFATAWNGRGGTGGGINGEAGQHHAEHLRRRNGGDSPSPHPNAPIGVGATTGVDASSGCVEIYQIRDFT